MEFPLPISTHTARRSPVHSLLLTLSIVAMANCGGDSPGPGGGTATLQVVPHFPVDPGAFGLTTIRIRVAGASSGTSVLDLSHAFTLASPNQSEAVSLSGSSLPSTVTLDLLAGSTVLYSGSAPVTLTAGSTTPLTSVDVLFVGPGATATTLHLAPNDTLVVPSATFPMRASATGAGGGAVAGILVSWSLVGAGAGAAVSPSGMVTAPGNRDTLYVKGFLPNGVKDSVRLRVVAAPSGLAIAGGNNQSASAGSRLPTRLAVAVTGDDALPVPGVVVHFSATTGGGTVDSASATTDPTGIARSGVLLGSTVGAQTFTASSTGLTSVVFNETATALPVSLTWTGAISSDWNVAGNWNPAQVPDSTSIVTIPGGTALAPAVLSLARAGTLSVAATATVTLPCSNLTVSGNALVDGSISGAGQVIVNKTAVIRGDFPNLAVTAPVTLSGNSSVSTLDITGGELRVAGYHLTVVNQLNTFQGGSLTMTDTADQVVVFGNAHFEGAGSNGKLTAGTIEFDGATFVEAGNGSPFAPSGSHLSRFPGTTIILFTDPVNSGFQNLDLSGGNITLDSDIQVAGVLTASSAAGQTNITSAATPTLTTRSVNVADLVIDHLALAIGAGSIAQFDSVTFTNSPTASAQLSIHNPGRATPYTFSHLAFTTVPAGAGVYLDLTDTDGATSGVLTLNLAGPTPATPGGFIHLGGGAVLNWP